MLQRIRVNYEIKGPSRKREAHHVKLRVRREAVAGKPPKYRVQGTGLVYLENLKRVVDDVVDEAGKRAFEPDTREQRLCERDRSNIGATGTTMGALLHVHAACLFIGKTPSRHQLRPQHWCMCELARATHIAKAWVRGANRILTCQIGRDR